MLSTLERPESNRYTVHPIAYPKIYNFYLKAQQSQWVPEEVAEELAKDSAKKSDVSVDVMWYIKYVVAFFAVSDGLVGETVSGALIPRIQCKEALMWYNHQNMMEDVHSIVYSTLVDIYIEFNEREKIFADIGNYPGIAEKIVWIHKWVGTGDPHGSLDDITRSALGLEPRIQLAQVILANVITEGVFFSGSFCAVFWLNHYYPGMLPGLAKANEWISRDEGMHTDFAVMLYVDFCVRLPEELVHEMFRSALEIEFSFAKHGLPTGLVGMNATLMHEYIMFTADKLLLELGYRALFGAKNPFTWMGKQSISLRITDFFTDNEVSEYGTAVHNGVNFDDL